MIEIEYLGENENGTGCKACGKYSTPKITKKIIYGKTWEVNKPQKIPLKDFQKYMLTGLFKKV